MEPIIRKGESFMGEIFYAEGAKGLTNGLTEEEARANYEAMK